MESIRGYDAWRLASPPELKAEDRCAQPDCRAELGVHEIAEGVCFDCLARIKEEMDA